MRILALSWKDPHGPAAGGAERYLLEVTRRWAAEGHQVEILGPRRDPTTDAAAGRRREQVKYIGLGSRWSVFSQARRHLRARGADYDRVLETVSTRPFAAHQLVGPRAVALYHQTAEEVWDLEFPKPIAIVGRRLLEPWWIRQMRGARVVANSPSTAAALRRFGVRSEAVVPPGTDPPRTLARLRSPGSPPHLLWIGRMVRAKRPDDAIAALTLIRDQIPGVTLDMVGTGYLKGSLEARQAAGVTVYGPVAEEIKQSLLATADLLLLPGTREGWGIVALEAASHGVPVVAYDIPGLRDSVVHQLTGLVVPSTPQGLAEGALQLLTDPVRWGSVAAAARARGLAFTWDACADKLLTCLTMSTAPPWVRPPGTGPELPEDTLSPRLLPVGGRTSGGWEAPPL